VAKGAGARAGEEAVGALQWVVDDGVAARGDVDAFRSPDISLHAMVVTVAVTRSDGTQIDLRFDDVWRQL